MFVHVCIYIHIHRDMCTRAHEHIHICMHAISIHMKKKIETSHHISFVCVCVCDILNYAHDFKKMSDSQILNKKFAHNYCWFKGVLYNWFDTVLASFMSV